MNKIFQNKKKVIHDEHFDIYLHSWVFLYNHQRNGTPWFQTVDDILSTFV